MAAGKTPKKRVDQEPKGRGIRKSLGISLTIGVILGVMILWFGPSKSKDLTISIIHTNDFHSRIEQVTLDGSRCRPKDAEAQKCYGGIARQIAMIKSLRETEPNPLLVDAGDRFQGSLFYNFYKSVAVKPFVLLAGYQAMTLGNHEFDDGPEELSRYLKDFPVPVVSATIDASQEPLLAGKWRNVTVVTAGKPGAAMTPKEAQERRIGVIGLTTPSTAVSAKPGPKVRFLDPVEVARAGVAELHAQGVKRIIVLSHLGLAEDEKLAAQVEGISVIIGGHTHTLLRTGDSRAAGPSPRVALSPSNRPVLIVQSYFAGIYLGFLRVTLNDAGVPTAWRGQPIPLDAAAPKDPTAQTFVDALALPLEKLLAEKVGETLIPLNGGGDVCRFGECNMGDLITDSMMEKVAYDKVQVAFYNGGGIRAGIPAGDVSFGLLQEVLPFANSISTFDLSGEDLRAALEHGVSNADDPNKDGTGYFLQTSGLRYVWDVAAPVGRRIVSASVRQADGTWADLDSKAVYRVATPYYLVSGGGGFTMFRDGARNVVNDHAELLDAVIEGVKRRSPITIETDGRIARAP